MSPVLTVLPLGTRWVSVSKPPCPVPPVMRGTCMVNERVAAMVPRVRRGRGLALTGGSTEAATTTDGGVGWLREQPENTLRATSAATPRAFRPMARIGLFPRRTNVAFRWPFLHYLFDRNFHDPFVVLGSHVCNYRDLNSRCSN